MARLDHLLARTKTTTSLASAQKLIRRGAVRVCESTSMTQSAHCHWIRRGRFEVPTHRSVFILVEMSPGAVTWRLSNDGKNWRRREKR